MILNDRDLSSFGALLKVFRQRRRLTQQQLAERVGVRRNTIGNWERGDFLPGSKTIVLELAQHLRLDEQESRHLLETSLTAFVPHWLVPLPRNPYFTGREDILEALSTQLRGDQMVALIQSSALHGLGGVGKTQIALEYAYRHALEYSAVFWIGAETVEHVVSSLLHVASVLQVPEREDKDQQRVIAAAQRWLTTHGQWLLIWDNVEDLALLDHFLPPTRSGAVLITTRRQALGTFARGIDLFPMEHEEGVLFLLRRAKVLGPEAAEQVRQFAQRMPLQYAAASDLVTALGGLPLALDQAGAYIEETQCGLPAYLELFRTQRAVLLQLRGKGSRNHPESVATTFRLSIARAAEQYPAVYDLLRVCALLQPDAIPEELFLQGAEHLGEQLQAACRDTLEWNRVIAAACSYSLLHRQTEDQTLSMHRLVQAVLLDAMTEPEQAQWSKRVIKALNTVFPEMSPETEPEPLMWQQGERFLPHALLCLQRTSSASDPFAFASLAYKTAQYPSQRGVYEQAEQLYRWALSIREQVLGQDHPQVAYPLFGLALVSVGQCKYEQAEALYQRARSIWEQTLGHDHPQVAYVLHALATLYREQSKYKQAEPLFHQALRIQEQALGPEHPRVAYSLNGLAILYFEQSKYEQAEALYQRALSLWEQTLGPEHPNVARMLHNLATLYREQSKYEQAEPLYQRALSLWEQALGPEHLRIAYPLGGLADLKVKQGKYEQADLLYRRALHIQEQALGPEHVLVGSTLSEQATLYREQGKYEQAEQLYQRALHIKVRHLGQYHPETAQTLYDFAVLQLKHGNLSESVALAERALKSCLQSLGDAHPKTVATQAFCAQLLQEQVTATEKTASEQDIEESPDACNEERQAGKVLHPLHKRADPSFCAHDPLQEFLDACCELHPHAWCRSADLWHMYVHWVEEHQQRFPLSRGAFIAQLKAHGCRADRTKTARIWRGIALVTKER